MKSCHTVYNKVTTNNPTSSNLGTIDKYIQTTLLTLKDDPSVNVKIINTIIKKIAPFNLKTINLLLVELRESFYTKIKNKVSNVVFNLTTTLCINEKYERYIASNGTYPIKVDPLIKIMLDLFIHNKVI